MEHQRGRRIGRASRRGATLIEAMVAMAVLAFGTASLASLITTIHNAKRKMAFQRTAAEVFDRVAAQIEDATCDADPTGTMMGEDAAFTAPPTNALVANVPPASCPGPTTTVVETCGVLPDTSPKVSVTWDIVAPSAPGAPFQTASAQSPPVYHLIVRVREVTGDPVKDAASITGPHIRDYPLTKLCNLRTETDPALRRAEFF